MIHIKRELLINSLQLNYEITHSIILTSEITTSKFI